MTSLFRDDRDSSTSALRAFARNDTGSTTHRPYARDDPAASIRRALDAEVEKTVGACLHCAHAPSLLEEQSFLASYAPVRDHEARQKPRCHRSDEEVVPPCRKRRAGVE